MKSGKRETMEGIELPNKESNWRKGKFQVLGNIGSRHNQSS